MLLRQVVVAASELDATAEALRDALGLGAPYADPGVALFGLRNAVMALGEDFVEVVSPATEDTAVGRHLVRRGGDSGYMLMLEVDDLAAARERAAALGVREVWAIALEDIEAVHLHPGDVGGAILSLDHPRPARSWRWAGPDWHPGLDGGRLVGATLAVGDPEATAHRWGELLDRPVEEDRLALDGSTVAFVPGDGGLVEVRVLGPEVDTTIAGVRFVSAV